MSAYALSASAAAATKARIRAHEGVRAKPYRCTEGFLTIGVGRNLDAKGLAPDEIELLFANDYAAAVADAERLGQYRGLDDIRRGVLVEMVFQMGLSGVAGFRNMLAALGDGRYDRAADEMLRSQWAYQTPARAKRLADIMRYGTLEGTPA